MASMENELPSNDRDCEIKNRNGTKRLRLYDMF